MNELLRLTKHHGAGNDFLVLVDVDGRVPLTSDDVRSLCDRHLGLGADGLIRVLGGRDGTDLAMELRNADGTVAEMSGNGIRCLAQAAVNAGLVQAPSFTVWTAAGIRTVHYRAGSDPFTAEASVDMGDPSIGAELAGPVDGSRVFAVDTGNPHLVVLGIDPAKVDLATLAEAMVVGRPEGANIEVVSVADRSRIVLRVWERGVGETLACGTGSCAVAAVTHSIGLTGNRVVVANPGGDLTVDLNGEGARLTGPTRVVAVVEVDRAVLRTELRSGS